MSLRETEKLRSGYEKITRPNLDETRRTFEMIHSLDLFRSFCVKSKRTRSFFTTEATEIYAELTEHSLRSFFQP